MLFSDGQVVDDKETVSSLRYLISYWNALGERKWLYARLAELALWFLVGFIGTLTVATPQKVGCASPLCLKESFMIVTVAPILLPLLLLLGSGFRRAIPGRSVGGASHPGSINSLYSLTGYLYEIHFRTSIMWLSYLLQLVPVYCVRLLSPDFQRCLRLSWRSRVVWECGLGCDCVWWSFAER